MNERFWSKVAKSDGCWEWTAARLPAGYGKFCKGKAGAGWVLAHRASWQMEHGDIPSGVVVCHRCDNRRCVRPEHLFLGTQLDNVRDCVAKGRSSRGERSGTALLTLDSVRTIRTALAAGERHHDIASRFGVARQTVTNISTGHRWAQELSHVAP
jgi:hypothetical protein